MGGDEINSLGEFLRHERERRGITIEQVASATKINIRLLHAIEADQFAELPAKPFIRGFVSSYARFIDLDSSEVLTRFDDFIDQKVKGRPTRDAGHSGYAFEKREGEQTRTVLWMVMGTFVVLGGAIMVFFKPSLHHHRERSLDKLRTTHEQVGPSPTVSGLPLVGGGGGGSLPSGVPAIYAGASTRPLATVSVAAIAPSPTPTATPIPTPTPTPVAAVSPKPNGKPDPLNSGADLDVKQVKQKVVFRAKADVVVRYKVDDKPEMRFVLRQDKVLVLKASGIIRFQVSNAHAITFSTNNRTTKLVSEDKSFAEYRGTATVIFPAEMAEKVKDPFPNDKPLPITPAPQESAAPQTSTP